MGRKRITTDDIWNRVDRHGPKGCWIWKGPTVSGYGIVRMPGFNMLAHRYIYSFVKGLGDSTDSLHHICGIKLCVNPEHLVPVSHIEHGMLHKRK